MSKTFCLFVCTRVSSSSKIELPFPPKIRIFTYRFRLCNIRFSYPMRLSLFHFIVSLNPGLEICSQSFFPVIVSYFSFIFLTPSYNSSFFFSSSLSTVSCILLFSKIPFFWLVNTTVVNPSVHSSLISSHSRVSQNVWL